MRSGLTLTARVREASRTGDAGTGKPQLFPWRAPGKESEFPRYTDIHRGWYHLTSTFSRENDGYGRYYGRTLETDGTIIREYTQDEGTDGLIEEQMGCTARGAKKLARRCTQSSNQLAKYERSTPFRRAKRSLA